MKYLLLVLLLVLVLMFASGCGMVCKNKEGDVWAISFFAGAVAGAIDPNTGEGSWVRVGEYKASGIEIIKDDDDYVISFDTSESRTEFDKMKFFFEAGVAAGKKVAVQ